MVRACFMCRKWDHMFFFRMLSENSSCLSVVYNSIICCSVYFLVADLVKIVERTVRSENQRSPNRPIYLVGESLGGCLALAVAAHNPDIDLVLILANPGNF